MIPREIVTKNVVNGKSTIISKVYKGVTWDSGLRYIPFIHIFLLVLGFAKIMYFLRCNESFGSLV